MLLGVFSLLLFPLTTPDLQLTTHFPPLINPLLQWRLGNPLIRPSHTYTPEMPLRLLDKSTVFLSFFFSNRLLLF